MKHHINSDPIQYGPQPLGATAVTPECPSETFWLFGLAPGGQTVLTMIPCRILAASELFPQEFNGTDIPQ